MGRPVILGNEDEVGIGIGRFNGSIVANEDKAAKGRALPVEELAGQQVQTASDTPLGVPAHSLVSTWGVAARQRVPPVNSRSPVVGHFVLIEEDEPSTVAARESLRHLNLKHLVLVKQIRGMDIAPPSLVMDVQSTQNPVDAR